MPRAKGELGTTAMHAAYQQEYETTIQLPLFRAIVEDFNKGMMDTVQNGHIVHLPFRLGQVYIEKRKLNFNYLKLDYGHWRKTGEKLFYTNRHSDGFQAYYHWRKDYCTVTHKSLYQFNPTRDASRTLAKLLFVPGGHKIYPQYIP